MPTLILPQVSVYLYLHRPVDHQAESSSAEPQSHTEFLDSFLEFCFMSSYNY